MYDKTSKTKNVHEMTFATHFTSQMWNLDIWGKNCWVALAFWSVFKREVSYDHRRPLSCK